MYVKYNYSLADDEHRNGAVEQLKFEFLQLKLKIKLNL
jgi:hypothetical protein